MILDVNDGHTSKFYPDRPKTPSLHSKIISTALKQPQRMQLSVTSIMPCLLPRYSNVSHIRCPSSPAALEITCVKSFRRPLGTTRPTR